MDFANVGALATMEWVLGQTPATPPAGLFIKLHTGDPGADGLNNAAANDLRKAVSWAQAANIGTDGRAESATDADVDWSPVPTTETYSYVSFWDDLTAGNCWYKGAMTSPIPVTAGGDFKFAAGQTLDHS